jgi:hypothetical protein
MKEIWVSHKKYRRGTNGRGRSDDIWSRPADRWRAFWNVGRTAGNLVLSGFLSLILLWSYLAHEVVFLGNGCFTLPSTDSLTHVKAFDFSF